MESAHSRFPVCQGGLDNVLGMLHVTDLLGRSFVRSGADLTVSLQPTPFESTRGLKVLGCSKNGIHMALVVDDGWFRD